MKLPNKGTLTRMAITAIVVIVCIMIPFCFPPPPPIQDGERVTWCALYSRPCEEVVIERALRGGRFLIKRESGELRQAISSDIIRKK